MTIENLINLANDNSFKICIYDLDADKELFDDIVGNIPDDLLYYDIDSWELYNNKLCININTCIYGGY